MKIRVLSLQQFSGETQCQARTVKTNGQIRYDKLNFGILIRIGMASVLNTNSRESGSRVSVYEDLYLNFL
jgi:hypothetical protein